MPPNEKLLGYWDTVADRLFKLRHCMSVDGVVRQLPLYPTPLDPAVLIKAVAAGIDIGGVVAGTNRPVGPLRALPMIKMAAELAGYVSEHGRQVWSAIESDEAESLAVRRQRNETQIQQIAQEVRFLQWKNAEQATESLLQARAGAWERYRYYLRMQGLTPDAALAPEIPTLDRKELTEEKFDDVFAALVGAYEQPLPTQPYRQLRLAEAGAPSNQAGATSAGDLHLTINESAEVNYHLPLARDLHLAASVIETVGSSLTSLPDLTIDAHYWGLGFSSRIAGRGKMADAAKIGAEVLRTIATYNSDQAGIARRTASLERRADDWILQANLAAGELAHFGRQIIGSLILEQHSYRDYVSAQTLVTNSEEVETFLQTKFANEETRGWRQSELSRRQYQWYCLAVDVARTAEFTMKQALRRAEVDATDYIAFNYWDTDRKGLLAGEALLVDIKRMELAYHENNKRELELTRQVSLRQLDPLALLRLKVTGTATFTIPEWFWDLGYHGHYLRRINSVAVSVPCVVGPYTPLPCMLSLQRSTIRVSPVLADGTYQRTGTDDARFVDMFGPVESIVTSTATNDTGVFESSMHDDRRLPFEGAGAADSIWQIDLPSDLRNFDHSPMSDVVLTIRHTARYGGDQLRDQAVTEYKDAVKDAKSSGLALLFSLRHDFPTAWAAFTAGTGNLEIGLNREHFPYIVQGRKVTLAPTLELYGGTIKLEQRTVPADPALSDALNTPPPTPDSPPSQATLKLAPDNAVLRRDAPDVYLVAHYGFEDA